VSVFKGFFSILRGGLPSAILINQVDRLDVFQVLLDLMRPGSWLMVVVFADKPGAK